LLRWAMLRPTVNFFNVFCMPQYFVSSQIFLNNVWTSLNYGFYSRSATSFSFFWHDSISCDKSSLFSIAGIFAIYFISFRERSLNPPLLVMVLNWNYMLRLSAREQ
jgi:hypothetical protein